MCNNLMLYSTVVPMIRIGILSLLIFWLGFSYVAVESSRLFSLTLCTVYMVNLREFALYMGEVSIHRGCLVRVTVSTYARYGRGGGLLSQKPLVSREESGPSHPSKGDARASDESKRHGPTAQGGPRPECPTSRAGVPACGLSLSR